MVVVLTAAFGRLSFNPGWKMMQYDCGIGFVSVLAAGTTSSAVTYFAFAQQCLDRELNRMQHTGWR